eukprot:scaffold18660_cov47-Phaeocystis_antarctica.AAC.1
MSKAGQALRCEQTSVASSLTERCWLGLKTRPGKGGRSQKRRHGKGERSLKGAQKACSTASHQRISTARSQSR